MKLRGSALTGTVLLALTLCLPATGYAQSWPDKPIRVIVPFPPAGGTDMITRQLVDKIATATKWAFVIDNRPGASGNLGLEALARSAPDGYTIGMGQTANLAINPSLYSKMSFDALKDFAPVGLVSTYPMVLVVAVDSPYRSLAEVVAAAKTKSGAVSMASAGSGTLGHMTAALLESRAGVKFLHIPYKGAAPAHTDLIGRQVDIMFTDTASATPLVAGGKLRALAVSSAQRIKSLASVPAISELGYDGFEAVSWHGLLAPAGTPAHIIARLNAETTKALASADLIEKLAAGGVLPLGGSPQQFAEFLRTETAKWSAAVRVSGAKLD